MTAVKKGLKTAVCTWPGAEINFHGMGNEFLHLNDEAVLYLHIPIFHVLMQVYVEVWANVLTSAMLPLTPISFLILSLMKVSQNIQIE